MHPYSSFLTNNRRAHSSAAFSYSPKHYVHNISVVHIDGGEGGIRRLRRSVRNGRPALPAVRLPWPPLLTGLSPRCIQHCGRSAPPLLPASWRSGLNLFFSTKKRPQMRSLFRGGEGGIRNRSSASHCLRSTLRNAA